VLAFLVKGVNRLERKTFTTSANMMSAGMQNPLLGAKSAVLGFPQVEHLFKTGVPKGRGGSDLRYSQFSLDRKHNHSLPLLK
jgi:hypothetical protein